LGGRVSVGEQTLRADELVESPVRRSVAATARRSREPRTRNLRPEVRLRFRTPARGWKKLTARIGVHHDVRSDPVLSHDSPEEHPERRGKSIDQLSTRTYLTPGAGLARCRRRVDENGALGTKRKVPRTLYLDSRDLTELCFRLGRIAGVPFCSIATFTLARKGPL
jgi:hypothetical protein